MKKKKENLVSSAPPKSGKMRANKGRANKNQPKLSLRKKPAQNQVGEKENKIKHRERADQYLECGLERLFHCRNETKSPRTSATKDFLFSRKRRRGVVENSRCSMSAENCLMASSEAAAIVRDGVVKSNGRGESRRVLEFRSFP
jgi:hypothetical protein